MKRGKKYKKIVEQNKDQKKPLKLKDALEQVKKNSYSKFEGSVEIHIATKSKEKEYSVRGSISLPHSFGTEKKVLVFCEDKDSEKAKKEGADYAGLDKLMKQVEDGEVDFDLVLATPQVMAQIASLGKTLGPKGLMPNPKTGTLIKNFDAIKGFKTGKITFKIDDSGVIHTSIGKTNMDTRELAENAKVLIAAVKETCSKNKATIKSIYLSPTMGPSVELSL